MLIASHGAYCAERLVVHCCVVCLVGNPAGHRHGVGTDAGDEEARAEEEQAPPNHLEREEVHGRVGDKGGRRPAAATRLVCAN